MAGADTWYVREAQELVVEHIIWAQFASCFWQQLKKVFIVLHLPHIRSAGSPGNFTRLACDRVGLWGDVGATPTTLPPTIDKGRCQGEW